MTELDAQFKKLNDEIERLREAIKRTAKRHESTLEVAVTQSGIVCDCEICWIAREGR
jgi:hypothetical protein